MRRAREEINEAGTRLESRAESDYDGGERGVGAEQDARSSIDGKLKKANAEIEQLGKACKQAIRRTKVADEKFKSAVKEKDLLKKELRSPNLKDAKHKSANAVARVGQLEGQIGNNINPR